MATHGITLFGVLFVTVIISQQYRLSYAQQFRMTCSQTGFKGGLRYTRAVEVAQDREHELSDDFGIDLDDILYRRKRSETVG